MKRNTLTRRPAVAKDSRMDQRETFQGRAKGPDGRLWPALQKVWRKRPVRLGVSVLSLGMVTALSGCITVSAPDKPIVIELNINIKQEVIYRLAADAGKTIDSNKDIF
ncbi:MULTISPECIES: YnbE family lipoprotein [unclassified Novosphingobium]|uniref:YnbE family lipoprotein n=1 Tax=unclassified Novosphingobium TaxID=2644732 RepID=UPI000AAB518A|nr:MULTISPECIES: YnbE family lipoprotein [unclassified Novosphingobium]MDR6708026.1 hypothetical protein [Novosphingobium sp. 1748]NKJ00523.1 hypothetical protein [Novosphingobium sp. SG707]